METVPWQKILDKWDAYQLAANKTAVYPKEYLVYPVLGLVGEAGEFMMCLTSGSPQELIKEAGDILWYCAEICTSRGVKLSDCWRRPDGPTPNRFNALINASRLAEAYKKAIRSGAQAPDLTTTIRIIGDVILAVDRVLEALELPTIPEIMEINIEKLAARALAGTLKERGNRPPNPPYIDPKHGQQRG